MRAVPAIIGLAEELAQAAPSDGRARGMLPASFQHPSSEDGVTSLDLKVVAVTGADSHK
jgi:hypothetical protein